MAGFTSYTDYIYTLTEQWPEFNDLHEFLRQRVQPFKSSLSLVELSGTSIRTTSFQGTDDEWRTALHDRKDDMRARVLVLSYANPEEINREVLDAVAMLYDLDPVFLWSHLDTVSLREYKVPEGFDSPTILPSQMMSLETGFRKGMHASIHITSTNTYRSGCPFEGESL